MPFKNFTLLSAILFSIPFIQGCNFSVSTSQGGSGGLSCSLSLSNSSTTVVSGQSVDLTLSITGGSGNYSLDVGGPPVELNGQYQFPHTFTNTQSSVQTQELTLNISDGSGDQASCDLSVAVAPSGSGSGSSGTSSTPLACQLAVQESSPEVDQPIQLVATGTGGTGAYTFSGLGLGSDPSATVVSPLSVSSSTQSQAVVEYSAAGNKSATVSLSDASGTNVSCSSAFYVRAPAISVTLSPASGITPTGVPIDVTATLTGFKSGDTPDFSFKTSEPGVSVTSSGDSATVVATDGKAHDFQLTLTAQDPADGDSVSTTAHLIFTSSSAPLTCAVQISPETGSLYPVLPYVYYYYAVSASIPVMDGATNPTVTGIQNTAWASVAYASDPMTVNVDFLRSVILQPQQEPVTITLEVEDDNGRTAQCSSSPTTVWAY